MDQRLIEFLKKEKVAVLTTIIAENCPHSAVMHFSLSPDSDQIYFSTDNRSRKCQILNKLGKVNASMALGFSETEWKTAQIDGELVIADLQTAEKIKGVHYAKNPESKKYEAEPTTIYLIFTPTWWRYSDIQAGKEGIVSSENP